MATSLPKLAVSRAKLVDYLLDRSHPVGGPKATFFLSQGFARADPFVLALALVEHATSSSLRRSYSPYGLKLVFDGPMETPSGTRPDVRPVWMQPYSGDTANLVTAYPL